jgi:FkbM family methyltransferase
MFHSEGFLGLGSPTFDETPTDFFGTFLASCTWGPISAKRQEGITLLESMCSGLSLFQMVFGKLQTNIAPYSNQRAIQALLTDKKGAHYTFHIANNDGASSSILELHLHKDIWPTVTCDRSISLESTMLCSLAADHGLDLSLYPALVIDTQGSELLVLRGAEGVLHNFKYIKTEVADFESYVDCCQLQELRAWLFERGYREFSRRAFATHPNGGHYYDVVFQRAA